MYQYYRLISYVPFNDFYCTVHLKQVLTAQYIEVLTVFGILQGFRRRRVALSKGNSFRPFRGPETKKTILGLAGMEKCCPRISRGFSATKTARINLLRHAGRKQFFLHSLSEKLQYMLCFHFRRDKKCKSKKRQNQKKLNRGSFFFFLRKFEVESDSEF